MHALCKAPKTVCCRETCNLKRIIGSGRCAVKYRQGSRETIGKGTNTDRVAWRGSQKWRLKGEEELSRQCPRPESIAVLGKLKAD
jgi:hypothetical protein